MFLQNNQTNNTITTGLHTFASQDCAPPLTAKLAPWMRKFVQQTKLVADLLNSNGSPVHILVASEFGRNVDNLLEPFLERKVEGGLFFARKANKLPWFVSEAQKKGIGVDVASLNELQETLRLGVSPKQIVVTAIGKSSNLINIAISNNCLIMIDNADELELVESIAQSLSRPARIGLRFAGFYINGKKIFSRFGFSVKDSHSLLLRIIGSNWLKIEFLHAHIDRYDINERAAAIRQLIEIVDDARHLQCKIEAIDIGGGILIRYLENSLEWSQFEDALTNAVKGERSFFTFREDGLGLMRAGKEIIGQADLYPMWNDLSKERFIRAILDHQQDGMPLYKELNSRGLKLYFEPGRALLDNVGITLAEVKFRKRDTEDNLLIGLAMNRMQLRPFRTEFCSDPLLINVKPKLKSTEGAYLVGCLCSESDTIYRRKLNLDFLPQPGDIFCFANTAGYLSHHLEVGTHGDPLPSNLLIDPENWNISQKITDMRVA
jgi:diaminopimelate decarboxylase